MTFQGEIREVIWKKIKKFVIGQCIHHRMAADNARWGLAWPHPPHLIGLMKFSIPTHMTSNPNGHILSSRWPYLENDETRAFSMQLMAAAHILDMPLIRHI